MPAATASSSAVLDLDVKGGKVADFRYRLLPVFSDAAAARPRRWPRTSRTCARRSPRSSTRSSRPPKALLYRRGNFNGTSDQLILEALMAEKNAQIAFSPGFRWGTSLLPGPGDHAWST